MGKSRKRLGPQDLFCCELYRCTMRVAHCLERRAAVWPGGNRLKNGTVRAKRAPVYPSCAACPQGRDNARRCAWDPGAGFAAGSARGVRRYSPVRLDAGAQRVAGRIWLLSLPPGTMGAAFTWREEADGLAPADTFLP